MKKIFIYSMLFIFSLPSFALCPIDEGESVCSLPSFRERVSPTYIEKESVSSSPNVMLQPLNRQDPIDQMREPNNSLNYNSSCQFGVCMDKPNRTLLPQSER